MDSVNLDLNNLVSQQKYSIKINSENFENPKDGEHRRWKEKMIFRLVIISVLLGLSVLSSFIFLNPDSKNIGIALSGIISLVIGISGYYLKGI